MILVGTSGFRYRDWTPVFYPEGLDPGEWLRYYSRRFGCCELGFTCYRIPEAQEVQEIMEETRGALPLVFRAPLRLDNPGLVRFPPEFVFLRDNFSGLLRLRDSLEGIRLIAEFGSAGWHSAQAAVNARMLIDILAATAKEARVPPWTAKSST